jgi:pimeloyl-ACP methyl ester carboxylesterase
MRYVILFSSLVVFVTQSFGQSNPLYIPFQGQNGPAPSIVKGALYKPDHGPAPHVAFLVMHRSANVMGPNIHTQELTKRGFMVLGLNTHAENNEAAVRWDEFPLDVKFGVEFLRKQPGITKVILLGHSGGGATMTYYQAAAEKGPKFCQGPNKLTQCSDKLAGLPPVDGLILVDAHPGNPVSNLKELNPAVVKEGDSKSINPDLDPFNPKNGFKPAGESRYSEEFRQKYFKAQADRMNRLIKMAQDEEQQIKRGNGPYQDDDVFVFVRAHGARLLMLDPTIREGTVKPRKLLKNDGTISEQVIESVRHDELTPKQNASFSGGTMVLTLRSFLGANAIRATDSWDGIDDCSSNNSVPCAVQAITIPTLIMAMGAHHMIKDSERYYELSASHDKDFVVVEGATHSIVPCTKCEEVPGQYSNSVKNTFDYIQKWVEARY